MVDLHADRAEATEEGDDGKDDGPLADEFELLEAEDMAETRYQAEPGAGDNEENVGGDENPPGDLAGHVVNMGMAIEQDIQGAEQPDHHAAAEESKPDFPARTMFEDWMHGVSP